PTVHVLDASRAVGVVSRLVNPETRAAFDVQNRKDQEELRELHAHKRAKPLLPLADANARRFAPAWRPDDIAAPAFLGTRQVEAPLAELVRYIDWTFFFTAWELRGRFPAILDHPQQGPAARELYANARKLLDDIVAGGKLRARGVYGFWPAAADGNDIVLFA